MKELIRAIVKEIPKNMVFDSHTVIFRLIQLYSDDYLANFTGGTTEIYHGNIGKIIAEFENDSNDTIKRVGDSWSKNIKDNFSKCTCWVKL